jgi:hypothetical protein
MQETRYKKIVIGWRVSMKNYQKKWQLSDKKMIGCPGLYLKIENFIYYPYLCIHNLFYNSIVVAYS